MTVDDLWLGCVVGLLLATLLALAVWSWLGELDE